MLKRRNFPFKPSGLSALNFSVAKLVKSFGLDRELPKVLTTSLRCRDDSETDALG